MSAKKLPPPEKRCQEKRKNGMQCRAARVRGSEYCLFHHPYVERQRNALDRLDELELKESSDIHELLAEAVEGVKSGKLTTQQAYALAGLVKLLRENQKDVAREEKRAREEMEEFENLKEPEFGDPKERPETGGNAGGNGNGGSGGKGAKRAQPEEANLTSTRSGS
jgi:hypothetical protein